MRISRLCATALTLSTALAARSAGAYGEPVDGYPSHDERLILVTINRVRANPDDQAAGNAQPCSTPHPPVPPVAYDATLGRSARFHCRHLELNSGGLSHQTFCTLTPEIATNGCDGQAACSCMPGTECWNCDTLGGCGTGPSERAAIFGFMFGVAEVGAAGYGPAGAGSGWATECPPNEGHRNALSDGGLQIAGTGFASGAAGCWGDFEFADLANIGDFATPRIASAIAGPATVEANWYDPAGDPQTIDAVVDGACLPMTVAVGITAGNRDYQVPFVATGACQEYYIVARDQGGVVTRYPDVGSLTVGCPDEYVPTQQDAPCSGCNAGDTRPCTQGSCEGMQACEAGAWAACDAPATCGTPSGAGGGTESGVGAGMSTGGAASNGDAADESGGCGCRIGARPSASIEAACVALALLWRRRRRTGQSS